MRTGYDAVAPRNMPRDGQVYGGYVDGHWPTFPSLNELFPGKRYLSITVNGTHDALCADVENGDFSPQGGARWAADKLKRSPHAMLYCSASPWPQVRGTCQDLGILGKVMFWIAGYDNHAIIPPGAIGHQFRGDFHGYDQSVFLDHIPGLDPDLPPPPTHPAWFVRELSFPIPRIQAGVLKRVNVNGQVVPLQFGKDVMVVQKKVGAHIDGLYGPGTKAKVEDYQGEHKLTKDGIVGPVTARVLGP